MTATCVAPNPALVKRMGRQVNKSIWSLVEDAVNAEAQELRREGQAMVSAVKTGVQDVKQGAQYVGGALAGGFNPNQTNGQIFIDAVISMFPVAGEVTAARDVISTVLNMHKDPEKVKSVLEWTGLVLAVLAVVPVVGGTAKGVGKLLLRVGEKNANVAKIAESLIWFLNKMGHGDAVKWLKNSLNFLDYAPKLRAAMARICDRLVAGCQKIMTRFGHLLPESLKVVLTQKLPNTLKTIKNFADHMIPQVLKDLDAYLFKIRTKLVDGTLFDHGVITIGKGKVSRMVKEGRQVRVKLGPEVEHVPATRYTPRKDWPELDSAATESITGVSKASNSEIVKTFEKNTLRARELRSGREITLYSVHEPNKTPFVNYWYGEKPKNGEDWRNRFSATFGDSNNGRIAQMNRVPTATEMKAAGVPVPGKWNGMHVWSGNAASKYDKAAHGKWEGGGPINYIDWTHPANQPVKIYLTKILQSRPTGWMVDVDAIGSSVGHAVEALHEHEEAKKTVKDSKRAHVHTSDKVLP